MKATRGQILPVLMTAGLLAAGCDSRSSVPSKAEASLLQVENDPFPSPAEVVELLHESHLRRDYEKIMPMIVAEQRRDTVAFLKAMDRVIDLNASLREVAEQQYGGPMSDAWDLTAMENNLGVFSRQIDVINQRFKGKTALVTFQEGDNVPLVRAELDLTAEGWRLRPALPPRAAVPELEKLAQILADVRCEIEEGMEFEEYFKTFVERVLPQMQNVLIAGNGA